MKKKKILFVCVENSCRSQMAEGLANHFCGDVFQAFSAGSKPSGKVNPAAVQVMQDAGIDIAQNKSKRFTDLPMKNFDYVVTLGCQDTCPFVPGRRHIDWEIEDPKGKGLEFFRRTREEIKQKIMDLYNEVGI